MRAQRSDNVALLAVKCVVEERARHCKSDGRIGMPSKESSRPLSLPQSRVSYTVALISSAFHKCFPEKFEYFIESVIKAVISRRYIGRSGLLAVSDASTRGHVLQLSFNCTEGVTQILTNKGREFAWHVICTVQVTRRERVSKMPKI